MLRTIISLITACALSSAVHAQTLSIKPNAPAEYTVQKGDTLWDISGRYLSKPWHWPQLWKMNQTEIKNPHWIYPGDTLILDRRNQQLTLKKGDRTIKLSPQIRYEDSEIATQTIPYSAIQAMIRQPLVMESNNTQHPQIIGGADERIFFAQNDKVYSQILPSNSPHWQSFRPSTAIIDPDTKALLGYEAVHSGNLSMVGQKGKVTELNIDETIEEISIGDRLQASPDQQNFNIVPQAGKTTAKVIRFYGNLSEDGQFSNIMINKGRQSGIELGQVFLIQKVGRRAKLPQPNNINRAKTIQLPNETIGKLLIYRVFDKVAYGLAVESTQSIQLGDLLVPPEE